MIKTEISGDFNDLEKFLKAVGKTTSLRSIERMGEDIVRNLRNLTPKDSSKTANSWRYEVTKNSSGVTLEILNSNLNGKVSIARLIHFGHGTGTGGYVPPRPFIDSGIDSIYRKNIENIFNEILKKY